jgi:hypothetical protein
MASFAKLNSSNIVECVISINNNELLDNGIESEEKGIQFCKYLFGQETNWKQTSYNTKSGVHMLGGTPFRKNFAGIGYTYDQVRDAFIGKKPYASWLLNEDSCVWVAPIPCPADDHAYSWNEENQTWDLIF